MPKPILPYTTTAAVLLACSACAAPAMRPASPETTMFEHVRRTVHRGDDDLLSAGLGLEGLRAMVPPGFADPEAPTPAELRRRAIWNDWRGIADLAPGGGFGEVYGSFDAVPGREFSAYATVPGATHPHRVLVQVPDGFDAAKRCVVIAPASGSRGVYGAIALAGAWGLPKGCAVAYTDKAAGSDYFDLDAGLGVRADGTPGPVEAGDLAFVPAGRAGATGVATRHAHSQDNPEADWGRHVRQAAEFALQVLDEAIPAAAPFTFENTRIIATGISNGGGAVLRAAEAGAGDAGADWLDAVVAGEPNVHVTGHGGRPLYDYGTEAALLMPCALVHLDDLPEPPQAGAIAAAGALRCASLRESGLIDGDDVAAQARSAYERLRAGGWTDAALRAGVFSSGFDIWRAVVATYASSYGRFAVGEPPCGHAFSAETVEGNPRPATAAERAAWPADGNGIPPGAGVGIVDAGATGPDPALPGLRCLRALWDGEGDAAGRVRRGVAGIVAAPPRAGLPMVVVHGFDDGLIPMAFSSAPYVAMARDAGRDVRYWQVRHVQHFDAFLGFPDPASRYLPLLPYMHAALDRVWAHLQNAAPLPHDAVIEAVPRGIGRPLSAENLAIPR